MRKTRIGEKSQKGRGPEIDSLSAEISHTEDDLKAIKTAQHHYDWFPEEEQQDTLIKIAAELSQKLERLKERRQELYGENAKDRVKELLHEFSRRKI